MCETWRETAPRGFRFAGWHARVRTVYCFFNNDVGGHAPRDAARLIDLIGD